MEAAFINWLQQRVTLGGATATGIGDDAAVIRTPDPLSVLTSDMLMDGVDFELARCDLRSVGRKSLAVNLSDIAAMACRPVAAIVSLALPKDGAQQTAQEFYGGLLPLAEEFSVDVAGGDTNSWEGPFVASITVLGSPVGQGPVLRSGGQVGDAILVTGEFGGSIAGRHFDFRPRVSEAIWLAENNLLHAAIDVSDGLSLDVWRLADASGCGVELNLDAIPISDAARELAARGDRPALDHALSDGEDFELVVAVSAENAARLLADQPFEVPLNQIGRFVPEPGLWQAAAAGRPKSRLEPRGYDHLE